MPSGSTTVELFQGIEARSKLYPLTHASHGALGQAQRRRAGLADKCSFEN